MKENLITILDRDYRILNYRIRPSMLFDVFVSSSLEETPKLNATYNVNSIRYYDTPIQYSKVVMNSIREHKIRSPYKNIIHYEGVDVIFDNRDKGNTIHTIKIYINLNTLIFKKEVMDRVMIYQYNTIVGHNEK